MTVPIAQTSGAVRRLGDTSLALLHADLVAARSAHQLERSRAQRLPHDRDVAAADLLACLEAFKDALEARRLPIPRGMRDELRLRRRLSESGERSPGRKGAY
jgi:hypothetical protein